MAQITKSLSLDVSRQNRRRAIFAKQFDNDSRFLKIQLNHEGEPIEVAKTSAVLINATRADGASSSFMGSVNDDGSITVPITYWMLEVPGEAKCDVSVISEQGGKLSSLSFAIEVEQAYGNGEDVSESDDYDILVQLIADVKQLENSFKTVFIRYSANADGENYSDTWSEGMEYIGVANADSEPIDKSGYVWCRFVGKAQEHSFAVDSELSLDSENPVQNKAVTQEFKAFNEGMGELNERLNTLEGSGLGGITVDSELSETSENPVQNKVITQKLKDLEESGGGGITVDFHLDTASENPVQNKVITAELNRLEEMIVSYGGEFEDGNPAYGNSSWNDLNDKPFGENEDGTVKQLDNKYLAILNYEASGETDYLPSYTATNMFLEMAGGISAFMLIPETTKKVFDAWMANQDNVTVVYDNVTYNCAIQEIQGMKAVGNLASMGGTGNNEPFVIAVIQEDADVYMWIIISTVDTAPTEHTVRVYRDVPEKWLLKEECLPFDAIAAYIDSYIDEALGGDY